MKHWAFDWDDLSDEARLKLIVRVCNLETTNSVTKDDLLTMLKWLSTECITVENENVKRD